MELERVVGFCCLEGKITRDDQEKHKIKIIKGQKRIQQEKPSAVFKCNKVGSKEEFANGRKDKEIKKNATKYPKQIIQGVAEITSTFRKIPAGSPKKVEGCDPFR